MPEAPGWERPSRLLRGSALALAIFYPVLYLVLATVRIRHPFELEWMEGGSLDHVRWILSGHRLYGPPSLEFIPFFYAPLYYYVGAAAESLLGPGFVPLRLVSILSSLGCLALIGGLVKRETGSLFATTLAVGLFAATYRLSGAWLDVARGDALFLLFLLLAVFLARSGGTGTGGVLAALFLGLAFFTKQTALLPAAFLCLHALLRGRRFGAVFAGIVLLLIVGGSLLLDWIHGGWFGYYTFVSPSRHPLVPRAFVLFWTRDVFARLGIASVLAALYFVPTTRQGRDARFYACVAAGMTGAAWLSRANVGGYDNVLLPAYAALSILFGLGIHAAREAVDDWPSGKRGTVETVLALACLIQLAGLLYNPLLQIPTAADREAGRRLVRRLAAIEGDVFLPGHPYLLALAGKATHSHFVAINEILTHGTPAVRARFGAELRAAIDDRRFAAIVLDSPGWFRDDVGRRYRDAGSVFDDDVFWPVTGARLRPDRIYLPN